jgi:hypothetical protein
VALRIVIGFHLVVKNIRFVQNIKVIHYYSLSLL